MSSGAHPAVGEPAEQQKMKKKGSFSNIMASLKKKGSSSDLAEANAPQATKPEKKGLFGRSKSKQQLADGAQADAAPPATPGAMGPLARTRADELAAKRSDNGSQGDDVTGSRDQADASPAPSAASAAAAAAAAASPPPAAPATPAPAPAKGLFARARSAANKGLATAVNGGGASRARAAAMAAAVEREDDEYAPADWGEEPAKAAAPAAAAEPTPADEGAAEGKAEAAAAAAAGEQATAAAAAEAAAAEAAAAEAAAGEVPAAGAAEAQQQEEGRESAANGAEPEPTAAEPAAPAEPAVPFFERARSAATRGLSVAVNGGARARAAAAGGDEAEGGAEAGAAPADVGASPTAAKAPKAAAAAGAALGAAGAAPSDGGSSAGRIPAGSSEADAAEAGAAAAEGAEGAEGAGAGAGEGGSDGSAPSEAGASEAAKDGSKAAGFGVFGVLGRVRSVAAKGLAVAVNGREDEQRYGLAAAAAAAAAAAEAEAAAAAARAEAEALAAAEAAKKPEKEPPVRKFPRGFMWGTATSAYQIEGAFEDEGKGLSIWDAFAHAPGKVSGGHTGDVTACHYYRYKEDVGLMRTMGVQYYRLSIAWSRIFPNGKGKVNDAGVAFYNRLIDELVANKIQPVVTLYHWDLPLSLQLEEDGWLNPKIVDHYVKYAKLCFTSFGDRVKHWITFNEPWCAAVLGHDSGGQHAPGRTVDPSREVYRVGHHMLLAHAKAYDVYQRLFKRKQRGKVGMALNCDWYEAKPAADPEEARRNRLAAARAREFMVGWFARPLFQGDYPAVMRERVGSRLPRFTREQRETLKGACDFFGMNHYSSHLCEQPTWHKDVSLRSDDRNTIVRVANQLVAAMGRTDSMGELDAADAAEEEPRKEVYNDPYIESTGYWQDVSVDQSDDTAWKTTDMGWGVHPEGIRKALNWVQNEFNPKGGIIITENGAAVPEESVDDALKDVDRAVYLKRYLTEVHKAILNDDVDVRGYFVWSLLDNFEWGYGFTKKFGLHYVDFDTLERIPKMSASWYAEVIKKNRLDMV